MDKWRGYAVHKYEVQSVIVLYAPFVRFMISNNVTVGAKHKVWENDYCLSEK